MPNDDLYRVRKGGKLKLKGEKNRKKKSSSNRHNRYVDRDNSETQKTRDLEDAKHHDGWRIVRKSFHLRGPVAIALGAALQPRYIKSLDNGTFSLSPFKVGGGGPEPDEILVAVPVGDSGKFALKSGFEKYLRVDKEGKVIGASDAIGLMEQWEVVFQEGECAILGANNKFLSFYSAEDDIAVVVCDKLKAGPSEMTIIRSNSERVDEMGKKLADEEIGSIGQVELNYVKKFQKFQNHKILLCTDEKRDLKRAKLEGTLHQAMLDRRSKMKADRYCK